MTIAVEAGSLSRITQIAANPPLHLEEHRHSLTQPLILYIARVPGRRDVFLTPLRPREKVVTAQDVQSSLYYIHVNDDEDTELVSRALQAKEVATEPINNPQHDPYALPSSNEYVNQNSPPPKHRLLQRKPLISDITNSNDRTASAFSTIPLLPPRPLPKIPDEACSPSISGADSSWSASTSQLDDRHDSMSLQSLPMTPSEMDDHEALSGALTVIRRDPATADQWNVAIVRDGATQGGPWTTSSTQDLSTSVANKGTAVDLEITNPAYRLYQQQSENDDNPSIASMSNFSRRLHVTDRPMSYHELESSNTSLARSSISSDYQKRRSVLHAGFLDSSTIPKRPLRRRSHQYAFASPWQGQCRFAISSTGQALKCSHHARHLQQACDVSELRFNLPLSARGKATAKQEKSQRFSHIGNMHRRLRSHDSTPYEIADTPRLNDPDDENDFTSMDLSLGQEQAGGGFGGKQAKLGKLIIYPDGLPMLDLLVAANIGLWWRVWDRTT